MRGAVLRAIEKARQNPPLEPSLVVHPDDAGPIAELLFGCDWTSDDLNPGPECPYCADRMCARFDGLGCTHNREERHG